MGQLEPASRTSPLPEKPVALLRQLGVVSATALVVSNMVGTGIFGTTGFLVGPLGDAGLVVLIWVVGAVCALAGAFCYSELGINYPSSGGEYVYLTQAYGPTWGFMSGWVSFFAGFSAPIAAASLAFSNYLGYFYPSLKQENALYSIGSGDWAIRLGGAQAAACTLIAAFTVLNLFGVRRVANIQNVLTSLKLLVLFSFIVLGFGIGKGDWSHFTTPAVRTTDSTLFSAFAIELVFIYTAYSGWNAATYVAEELKHPRRTLPLALTFGTILVAMLYVAMNIVFIYGAPLEAMKNQVAIGAFIASHLFGPGIAGTFSLLMAVSLMSTVNAEVTIGPRVYYAMAKNGAFPAVAAKVDPRWHTPGVAILCQGACAMLMTFLPFQDLLLYIGMILNFFAVLTVCSLFIFRRRTNWQRLAVVSFLYPAIPLVFAAVGTWITVYGFYEAPKIAAAATLTVAIGALVYHFAYRRSAADSMLREA